MFTMLDDWRSEFGVSETGLGLIVAIGFFTSFAAQLGIAPLADRGRARQLMILGCMLNAAGSLVMAAGSSFSVLFLGRIIIGVGAGMAIPAIRRIVIVTQPDRVGRNLGRTVAVEVGGFALGPLLSAAIVPVLGIRSPFLAMASVLALVTLVVSKPRVPETPADARTTERFAFDLLRNRALAGAIFVGLALYVMIGAFDSLWVLIMSDLRAPGWVGNAGIAVFGLPFILFGTLGGTVAQRVGPIRASTAGLVCGACFMAAYGVLGSPYTIFMLAVVHMTIDAFSVTGTGIMIAETAPPDRQAAATGLLGGMQTLTGGITATFAGAAYEAFGRSATMIATAATMVALVATGAVLVGRGWIVTPRPLTAVR
jgi:DHA1 family tetracycline resistance protein-like MFS transporter